MAQQMLDFFAKFLASPTIVAIGLAVVFGAIWLACYRPSLITKPWLWAILAAGAILSPIAIAVAAFPLKFGISWVYGYFWSRETLTQWALLASLPSMYIFGLFREGFKLVPVVIYWWRKDRSIEPKLGLAAGAVSGAGFGIIEALWTINYGLNSLRSFDFFSLEPVKILLEAVQLLGVKQVAFLWEGFFILGANVAACALAGWGLARGWGWQFYLIAALVFVCVNYGALLAASGLISAVQVEFLIAAFAFLATGVALWLGERKAKA